MGLAGVPPFDLGTARWTLAVQARLLLLHGAPGRRARSISRRACSARASDARSRAIRSNEGLAESSGISAYRHTMLAMVVACGLAGRGGRLLRALHHVSLAGAVRLPQYGHDGRHGRGGRAGRGAGPGGGRPRLHLHPRAAPDGRVLPHAPLRRHPAPRRHVHAAGASCTTSALRAGAPIPDAAHDEAMAALGVDDAGGARGGPRARRARRHRAVRRPRGRRGPEPRAGARRDPRADRPQWRRQVHRLQRDHGVPAAGPRPGRARRRADHRAAAVSHRRAAARAHVPADERLRGSPGVRQRPDRVPSPLPDVARAGDRGDVRGPARRARAGRARPRHPRLRRPRRQGGRPRPRTSRAASSGSSASPSRSGPRRRSCSSTSRRRGSTPWRPAGSCGSSARSAGARDERAARGARHEAGDGPLRPDRRPELRPEDRGGHAGGDPAPPRGHPRLPRIGRDALLTLDEVTWRTARWRCSTASP